MSTKASPPTSSATAATNSSAATTTSGGVIKIKSELPSDEIKEYAENTMNELLGWYGFDGVDRLDLSSKTSRLLHSSSSANTMSHHQMEKRRSRNRAATLLNLQQHNLRNNNNNNNSSSNNNNNNNNNNYSNIRISSNKNNVHNNNNNSNNNSNSFHSHNIGGCGGGNESTTSDHDTRSSREDDSKSPHSAGKTTIDEKIDYNNCCWCRRTVPENAPEFLTTTDGPRYCSESCFTQSRRASFKKAKTCDWCKHVRHAVSYVDFQDGASQLQFCSDKCLNQYKMQIFCKETQAHLDMNPHLREQGLEAAASGNGAGLITPDLWLRNCRSRSASPASTLSVSPAPPTSMSTISAPIARLSPPTLSQASSEHKPMISVTPASKLMSKSPGIMSSNRQSPKHSRKKRPLRSSIGSSEAGCSMKMNHGSLRREVGGGLGASGASQLLNSSKSLLSVGKTNSLRSSPGQTSNANSSSSSLKLASTPSLSQFAASSVQDLHMSVPPLSPMLEQQLPPPQHQHSVRGAAHSEVGGRGTSIPSAFFATPPSGSQHGSVPHQPTPQLGAGFPTRPPFLQHAPMGGIPRFMASMGFPHMQQPPLMHPDMCGLPSFLGAPPPVTVMVPYPIIIPLPIPIPVPLPIIDFYRAHLTPEQRQNLKQEEQQERERETKQKSEFDTEATSTEPTLTEMDNENAADEPLDCTKSRESPTTCEQNLPRTPTPESASLEPTKEQQRLAADTEHADEPDVEEKPTHHIVSSIEQPEDTTPGGCNSGASNPDDPDNPNEEDTNQKLPKLKITRLHTKRTLLQTKESECSRPLRKRKRIIDCDFQKIALSNKESEQEEFDNTNTVAGSSQTKNSSKK